MITFNEWNETAEHIKAIHVSRNWDRHSYKFPNNVMVYEETFFPYNIFKNIKTFQIVDLVCKITDNNESLIKKYNGKLDQEIGYTENGYGLPVFEKMENAYNFAMNEKNNIHN